jgi:hypothetical protein
MQTQSQAASRPPPCCQQLQARGVECGQRDGLDGPVGAVHAGVGQATEAQQGERGRLPDVGTARHASCCPKQGGKDVLAGVLGCDICRAQQTGRQKELN